MSTTTTQHQGSGKNPVVQMGFDVLSPYSYVAFKIMERYEAKGLIELDFIPVSLPAIFQITGNEPPMNRGKNKRNYSIHDLTNMARFADVEFNIPTKFPIDTGLVQTALVLIKQRHAENFKKAIALFYEGFFVKGLALNESEETQKVLTQLNLTTDQITQLVADIKTDASQSQLLEYTQTLTTAGAYGLPYFITTLPLPHQKYYFGCDRIELLFNDLGISYQGPNPNGKKDEDNKAEYKVQFAMDIMSPYAYFARKVLKRYEKIWNLKIEYVPLNLRTCVAESGNVSPVLGAENKAKYTYQDAGRISYFFQSGFNKPTKFPFNSLLAQTLLAKIKIEAPEKFVESMDLLWDSALSQDLDVEQSTVIQTILTPLFDAESQLLTKMVQSAAESTSQQTLVEESKKWVEEKGIFGMPFFFVEKEGGETFKLFGSDRLELLAHITGQKYSGPLPKI